LLTEGGLGFSQNAAPLTIMMAHVHRKLGLELVSQFVKEVLQVLVLWPTDTTLQKGK